MDSLYSKQIRIADYLHSLGYSPVKQQGVNLWYTSPLREEAEASFKVNTEREQWYDFGLGTVSYTHLDVYKRQIMHLFSLMEIQESSC